MESPAPPGWWEETSSLNATLMRPNITSEEVQALYKQWSESGTYDKVISDPKLYSSFTVLSQAVHSAITDSHSLILDVGAGTGLTGQTMISLGYKNLHALEPQADFAETCRSKGIYSKVLQEFIGGESPVGAPDDTYDAIVCTGAFGPGHIPTSAVPEMVRLVKPGGHVIICMREEFLHIVPEYKDKLEPLWDKLVDEKKWSLISRTVYPNHYGEKTGICVVYKVC